MSSNTVREVPVQPPHAGRRALLGAALLAPLTVPAPALADWFGSGPRVEGSGKIVEEPRAIAGFNTIKSTSSFDIELVNSPTESAVVRGDDNLLGMVELRVENGVLNIENRKGSSWRSRKGMTLTIHFKEISSLMLSGSGDLKADKINTRRFDASISGSSDVVIASLTAAIVAVSIAGSVDFTADGTAQKQGFNIQGSGDISAGNLKGETVAVRIAGSGDASVYASASLDVSIAGSGDVTYRGSPPRVRKSVAGSGSVLARD
ncbi:head GIN domain-containing protein [soil metagenome]